MAHALSCPETCGLFLDHGSNPRPLTGMRILNRWTTREALCIVFADEATSILNVADCYSRGESDMVAPKASRK